jgi:hypothetical protein
VKNQKGLALLKLLLEDDPLLHVAYCNTLGEAWLKLKSLYDNEGHLAVTTYLKQFLNLRCNKGNIPKFLNETKRSVVNLTSSKVELPDVFIVHWLLEKLPKSYSDFVTSTHASLR